MTTTPILDVSGLRKLFNGHVVPDSVDLTVPPSSVVSVLGRSGTGKSVLLKCLTGLLMPDAGEVRFAGRRLGSTSESYADFRRRSRFLFQGNALFDALNALENVALPLEQTTTISALEITQRARAALRRLGLGLSENEYPGQMSGGMQKRLALARALVSVPELVLFDEPTAGLDPLTRNAVFAMIARQSRESGFTAVIVTHDVLEALAVSDHIALLDQGRVRFQGTPAQFLTTDTPQVQTLRQNTAGLSAPLTVAHRHETASQHSL
ncbi:MAG: ATP-binding cassette domain-containing protein [Candidatus Synoicihabitans palmerolidicus]|nr:ATP-binding cassette domain-containing protein [Candidatus Synoicihabitans palmerolidicus]